ncbi:MAG: SGNH/GDSL hydrolase family protein [Anaerolineales bacterium]|nr:SGNH/GDSL hydrolase family protein [Anaerolineales bacterium]
MRFLALGDSYTIGESAPERERWPMQLAEALRERGFQVADPIILARTGWTTDELMAAVKQADLRTEYDLVSLQIGVNNQYRGAEVGVYRAEFRALLGQAIAYAGGEPGKVIVLSIPDWSVTPFAEGRDRSRISGEIDLFNQANYWETTLAEAQYIDVTSQSRLAAQDSALLAPDGLHPSGEMYAAWARLVLPAAIAALKLNMPGT